MITTEFDAKTGVLTAKAQGEITHEDYQVQLIPAIEEAVGTAGRISLLYVFTAEYEGFSARAAWDDARLGMMHLTDFKRIGVVADQDWIRHAVNAFAPFMPAELRTYPLAQLGSAQAWVAEA